MEVSFTTLIKIKNHNMKYFYTSVLLTLMRFLAAQTVGTPEIIISQGPCQGYELSLNNTELVDLGCSYAPQNDVALNAINSLDFINVSDFFNGITTVDLVELMKVIYGIYDDPYMSLVSDFNQDGAAGTDDLILMRRLILGIQTSVDWQTFYMVDANHVIPEIDPFDIQVDYSNYTFDQSQVVNDQLMVRTIRIGDLNMDAEFRDDDVLEKRSKTSIDFDNVMLETGKQYEVAFSVDHIDDIYGLTMKLDTENLTVESLNSNYSGLDMMTHITDESFSISYATLTDRREVEFQLKFTANADGPLSSFIGLNEDFYSELVDANGEELELELVAKTTNTTDLEKIVSIAPNPSSGLLNLNFEAAQLRTVDIYDNTGRQVLSKDLSDQKNELNLDMQAGLYLMTIQTGQSQTTRRIILK